MKVDTTGARTLVAVAPALFLASLLVSVVPSATATAADFIRGDVNFDGEVNLHDANLIYGRDSGVALECLDAADVNDDGEVTDADASALLEHLYSEGDAPPAPFPAPGSDPTEDELDCVGGEANAPVVSEAFSVEFVPEDTYRTGARGAVDLHAMVDTLEPVSGLWFRLKFDSSLFTRVTVTIPDDFKGVGRFTEGKLTETGADVAVLFSSTGAGLPAGLTEALKIRLCVLKPSPHPSWEVPIEVEEAGFSIAGEDAVKGTGAPVTVDVKFGLSSGARQPLCFTEPPAPDFFTCTTLEDGRIELSWSNPVVYDSLRVSKGREDFNLPGDATSWIDEGDPAVNNYVYGLRGYIPDWQFTETVHCTATDPREPVHFLRGDANSDGRVSLSDFVAIARWLFEGFEVTCSDTADVDDDGEANVIDQVALLHYFGVGVTNEIPFDHPPEPFPEPGPDPTRDGEAHYTHCEEYTVTPAESSSDDVITIGAVSAQPGEDVEVPILLTNTRPVEALQVVLRYDPAMIAVVEPGEDALGYEGAFYEQFFNRRFSTGSGYGTYGDRPAVSNVEAHPDEGILVISIVGGFLFIEPFAVPPGEDTLVAKLRLQVSGDAEPGSTIELTPTEPQPGEGFGLFRLRSELTIEGGGLYPAVIPGTIPGVLKIGIDGDISFFSRGDANGDGAVDLSDVVSVLEFLFLGGVRPDCHDAFDADDTGEVELTDAVVIFGHLFNSSATIEPPYPQAGRDPTPDLLPPCTRGIRSEEP